MVADATVRMDRMYRHQRHIYDLSRKFYLLGRDRLIEELAPGRSAAICEVGCGTGRNLVALARRYPDTRIYGIDASEEMLKTARARIIRERLERRVDLRLGLAETLSLAETFGRRHPFDAVIFSYTLSMIPNWDVAIDRGVAALAPGGVLSIVDFSEQSGLPAWFRTALRRWLDLFEVHPRVGLRAYVGALARRGSGVFTAEAVCRDYAILLRYRKQSTG